MINNCIKEITNQIRSVLAPPTNPHVVLMRSLLEITGVLRANPDYTNVIALLEKVHMVISHVLFTYIIMQCTFGK